MLGVVQPPTSASRLATSLTGSRCLVSFAIAGSGSVARNFVELRGAGERSPIAIARCEDQPLTILDRNGTRTPAGLRGGGEKAGQAGADHDHVPLAGSDHEIRWLLLTPRRLQSRWGGV